MTTHEMIPRGVEVSYYLPGQGEGHADAISLGSDNPPMPPWAHAQSAAEHFYNDRGGDGVAWPVDIAVCADGCEWLFSVELARIAAFVPYEKGGA